MLEAIETILSAIEDVIYIGDFPDNVAKICALYNTGGRESLKTFQGGSVIRRPSFQVRIRDTSYASGEARANAIVDLLNGATEITGTGYKILLIELEGDILDIGRDTKQRVGFTMNFKYLKQLT